VPHADVNGARLWYEDEGTGDPVLLVHHGLGDSRAWDEHAPALAERFRVIRPDLRFFGRSEGSEEPFSMVDDLCGVLDTLGIDRVAVVGHSFGGRVAIDFALEQPHRVRALVAVASGLGGYDVAAMTPEGEAAFEEAVAAGELERAADLELDVWAPLGADGAIRELAHANAGIETVDVEVRWPEQPAITRLGELAVPTLVVTGGRDVPDMTAIGDRLEQGVADARRVVFEDADHFVPQRDPDRFVELLSGFLTESRASSPA